MKAIEPLQIPVRGASVWPLSVAAYHVLGEAGLIPKRTELLYGAIYNKMSKSPLHSYLVTRLIDLIHPVLAPRTMMRSEQPITCSDSEPEPDIALVVGVPADFRNTHPTTAEVVIEVCVSSHDYDRSKLRAYASAAVKECWLVLAPEKQIEVHRLPVNGQFSERTVYGPGGNFSSAAMPGFKLDLATFFE